AEATSLDPLAPERTNKAIVKIALYNAINYYWEVPSKEGMLAALLDPWCKALKFASESLKSQTYNSLSSMFQLNNAQVVKISDYIGIPEISYDQCLFEW
ncbi:19486_t:CDS:2, partial [Cetraspora pellucida]